MPNQSDLPILPACDACACELYPEEHERGPTCFACLKAAAKLAPELSAQDFATLLGQCLSPDSSDEAQGAIMTWMEQGDFQVQTFEDACLVTRDAGIVVHIGTAQFFVTVIRNR